MTQVKTIVRRPLTTDQRRDVEANQLQSIKVTNVVLGIAFVVALVLFIIFTAYCYLSVTGGAQ